MKKNFLLLIILGLVLILTIFGLTGCTIITGQSPDTTKPGEELDGTQWKLVTLDGNQLVPGSYISLYFHEDGTVWGYAGCNFLEGGYTVSNNGTLHFSQLAITLMLCVEEDINEQEKSYLDTFSAVASYSLEGNLLRMHNDAGRKVLVFEQLPEYAMDSADLVGKRWTLASVNGELVTAEKPVSIYFESDSSATGEAGAFKEVFSYRASGDNIEWYGTRAIWSCEKPSEEEIELGRYTGMIAQGASYILSPDRLEIFTFKGDTLVYEPLPPAEIVTGPLTLEITSPAEGKETSWGFTRVRGTVSPISAVVSINNWGYARVEADGSFESDYVVLNEGKNEIHVTATIGGEEVTRMVTVNYTLDLHVSISLDLEPGKDWLTESPARIGGRVSDPHAEVTINGQKAEVGNDGYILAIIDLQEGTNTLTAVARLGDQTDTDTREAIYVPPAPLTIEITAPDDGETSMLDMVKITGTVSDPEAHVVISNTTAAVSHSTVPFPFVPARVTAAGAFYAYVTLEKGDNRIEASALRGSDHTTDTIDIEYDPPFFNFAPEPELTITSPLDNTEYRINVLPVTGTVDDPGVTVLVNGIETIVAADGSFRGCVVLDNAMRTETDEYIIEVIALNNARKNIQTVMVNFTPPLIVTLYAETELGVDYTKEPMSVSGMVNKPEASVTVNGKDVPVNGDGLFKTQVMLKEGNNRILAVATCGDETDEMYILNFIENGDLGVVPGYSHFFDAFLDYEHEIVLKSGETSRLPITLETRKDGPGGFSGSFVYVDREYGLTPLPWPEGLDAYLEPAEFTAYPNATYNFELIVSAVPELDPGIYYLHFYQHFENGFYGSGWIKLTIE